jgi:DNA-binding SARP family transcriptional activator
MAPEIDDFVLGAGMDTGHGSGPTFELHLLGGFVLMRSATPVPVPKSLQRLIVFLALHGPAPRRTAAGVLWPSTSDDRAMASMRTAVWRLQRSSSGLLAQSPDSLALHPRVAVDVTSLAGGADSLPPMSRAGGTALELLPGWYDDWVIMDRERLRHRYLQKMEAAASAAIDEGRLGAALDIALAAVAADPLRESAHRLVIRVLLADGNVDAARRHFTFVRDILREQLGLPPSAQLMALLGQARAGPPVRRGSCPLRRPP